MDAAWRWRDASIQCRQRTRDVGIPRVGIPGRRGVRDTRESVLHEPAQEGHGQAAGDGNIRVGDRTFVEEGCLQRLGLARTRAFGTGTAVQTGPLSAGRCFGGHRNGTRTTLPATACTLSRVFECGRGTCRTGDFGRAALRPQAGRGVSRNCMVRSASHCRSAGPSPKARCRLRSTVVRASHRPTPS